MIGLDTNILVRLFAEDDEVQRHKASRLLDGVGARQAYVNLIVVVELIWVLRRSYRFERDRIAAVLRKLTEHPNILLPDKDIVRDAAHLSREEGGDIADHLIALLNAQHNCSTTYTFDEDAAHESKYFTLLS